MDKYGTALRKIADGAWITCVTKDNQFSLKAYCFTENVAKTGSYRFGKNKITMVNQDIESKTDLGVQAEPHQRALTRLPQHQTRDRWKHNLYHAQVPLQDAVRLLRSLYVHHQEKVARVLHTALLARSLSY